MKTIIYFLGIIIDFIIYFFDTSKELEEYLNSKREYNRRKYIDSIEAMKTNFKDYDYIQSRKPQLIEYFRQIQNKK